MKPTIKKLITNLILLTLAMLTVISFWKNTVLTSVLLIATSIGMLIKASKVDILFFLIVGLGATIVESLTISSGAWVYSTQHIGIMPLWIPIYWGMGGTVMKDIYLFLKDIVK